MPADFTDFSAGINGTHGLFSVSITATRKRYCLSWIWFIYGIRKNLPFLRYSVALFFHAALKSETRLGVMFWLYREFNQSVVCLLLDFDMYLRRSYFSLANIVCRGWENMKINRIVSSFPTNFDILRGMFTTTLRDISYYKESH